MNNVGSKAEIGGAINTVIGQYESSQTGRTIGQVIVYLKFVRAIAEYCPCDKSALRASLGDILSKLSKLTGPA